MRVIENISGLIMKYVDGLSKFYDVCRVNELEMKVIVKRSKNINRLVVAGEDVQVTMHNGSIFYYMTNREWTYHPAVENALEHLHEKMVMKKCL